VKYVVAVILGCIVWTGSALAADLSITDFHADITLHTDASVRVVETIDVDFRVQKHGIFRNIPFLSQTVDVDGIPQGSRVIPIYIDGVTDGSGNAVRFETAQTSDQLILRIGDPNRTISGSQRYVLTYHAEAAASFFDDHDELYWNATGTDWDIPFGPASATVHVPSGVASASLTSACYTGEYGSRNQDCTANVNGSDVTFTAGGYLTVVVGMPAGTLAKPANYDAIRSNTEIVLAEPYDDSFLTGSGIDLNLFTPVRLLMNGLAIAVAVAVAMWYWQKYGRDPKGKGTVIAEYDPPADLRPTEVGVVLDERVDTKDITATIIDLAVRGLLTIEEVKSKKFLGIGTSTDYIFRKTSGADGLAPKLKPFERTVYDGIFDGQSERKLSDLKNEFYTTIPLVKKHVYEDLTAQGFFVRNPESVRIATLVIGLVVFGIGVALTFVAGAFSVAAVGLVMVIIARTLPQRTLKGVEALRHIRGFREFLHTAERYRLEWQEREKIFEKFLPYAMVLGVADAWAKTFEKLGLQPPDWYHGSSAAHFNSLVLLSAMNTMNTASASVLTSHPSSSGSGFGGGGFSGGGGGGGGGGGW